MATKKKGSRKTTKTLPLKRLDSKHARKVKGGGALKASWKLSREG